MKKKVFRVLTLLALALSSCNMPTAPSDITPPVLQNLGISDQSLFYSESNCGPTRFSISVDASDDSGVLESVGVQYRYRGDGGFGASLAWKDVNMTTEGNGHFLVTLDTAEADATLRQSSGVLEYQVYAVDMAGNLTTSPEKNARAISVQYCSSGVASDPFTPSDSDSVPAPPAPPSSAPADDTGSSSAQPTTASNTGGFGGGSSPTAEPTSDNTTFLGNADEFLEITTLQPSSNTIYYGQCNNNEPTSVTFYAQITPYEKYGNGQGIFAYYDPATDTLGGDIGGEMDDNGAGDFSFWTGDNLNTGLQNFFQGKSGNLVFQINAVSTDGLKSTSASSIYIDVLPCVESVPTVPPVVVTPTINYFNGPSASVEPNASYTVEWSVSDAACGVYVDNEQVDLSGSKNMTAPFIVGSDTATHTLIAYGEPCHNPTATSQNLYVAIEEADPVTTIVSGGKELFHENSLDLDQSGGVDVTFVHASSGSQFYGINGTFLVGTSNPSAENCALEVSASGTGTHDISIHDYICYTTGSGNSGYIYVSSLSLWDNFDERYLSSIFFTYETTVIP